MGNINNVLWKEIERETNWVYSKLLKDNVITSRVRLARNINGYPFPYNMTYNQCKEIEDFLIDVFLKMPFDKIFIIDISSLKDSEKKFLIERHLISREFSENGSISKVIIVPEKNLTIMINEEDHLRIQVIYPGFNLKKCWEIANEIDDYIDKRVEYAFWPNLGFLTACPTNVGTGLRSSVLIHIPGIKFLKREKELFFMIEKIGITVRGFYGEGSLPFSSIYQISSSESTGKREIEIIRELESVVKLLIEEEKNCIEEIKVERKLKERILKKIKEFYKNRRLNDEIYSLFVLASKTGILNIERKYLKDMFFSFLSGRGKLNYLFLKKEGKILKRKLGEIINV